MKHDLSNLVFSESLLAELKQELARCEQRMSDLRRLIYSEEQLRAQLKLTEPPTGEASHD